MRVAMAGILWMFAWTGEPSFETQITTWRKARETRLKAPDGWLSVAGLF